MTQATTWWMEWDLTRLLLTVLGGAVVVTLASVWERLHLLVHVVRMDLMNRLAPVLTVLPAGGSDAAGQGSFAVVVKNDGAGVAGDLQAEARWGGQTWFLPLPLALPGGTAQTLLLDPVGAGRRARTPSLEVTLRYCSVAGLVHHKTCWFGALPGGRWYIVRSAESVSARRVRRLERRQGMLAGAVTPDNGGV